MLACWQKFHTFYIIKNMERGKGLEYSLSSFSMMFKRGIDGLLHADSIKMLVNDGEMLVNDG